MNVLKQGRTDVSSNAKILEQRDKTKKQKISYKFCIPIGSFVDTECFLCYRFRYFNLTVAQRNKTIIELEG